jgi:hypothetical protein
VRPGRHAAEDGSFRRSAGVAAGRGAVLLLVAVVLGIFLLNKTDDGGTTTVSQEPDAAISDNGRSSNTSSTVPQTTTTTRPAHDPATVKVLAVNGTATSGIGARTKDVLLGARFNTLAPTDAKTKPIKTTTIYYQAGFDVDAVAIGKLLGFPTPTTQPMPTNAADLVKDARNVPNANVLVIAGEDVIPKLPAATTTTTARAASNTTTTARSASSTSSTTSTTKKP